jgi:hypothetical protein
VQREQKRLAFWQNHAKRHVKRTLLKVETSKHPPDILQFANGNYRTGGYN